MIIYVRLAGNLCFLSLHGSIFSFTMGWIVEGTTRWLCSSLLHITTADLHRSHCRKTLLFACYRRRIRTEKEKKYKLNIDFTFSEHQRIEVSVRISQPRFHWMSLFFLFLSEMKRFGGAATPLRNRNHTVRTCVAYHLRLMNWQLKMSLDNNVFRQIDGSRAEDVWSGRD